MKWWMVNQEGVRRRLSGHRKVRKSTYSKSAFALTRGLKEHGTWTFTEANARAEFLSGLAIKAWPR